MLPRSESIDKLISNLHVTEDERRRLVNTRIDPALMSEVLEFLYRADHVDSLPPMLQLSKQPHVRQQAWGLQRQYQQLRGKAMVKVHAAPAVAVHVQQCCV